ncbi:hypothetical protein J7E83_07510 [Arthrobacter sp. ISL-48]|uniref:hypothetical protein n=1 Tax=Arthrobacter sp. ISL-48 TaxID=2819110 RepID=UPI001BE728AE|nr:hypothetical protein [Arthrobacter sp. ISL-48]MBT2531972.1 hypothetical protein [Arthrobacter sp. ISL-48]
MGAVKGRHGAQALPQHLDPGLHCAERYPARPVNGKSCRYDGGVTLPLYRQL